MNLERNGWRKGVLVLTGVLALAKLVFADTNQVVKFKVVGFQKGKVLIADSNGVTQAHDLEQYDAESELQPVIASYQSDAAGNATERGELEIQNYEIKISQSKNRKELADNIFSLHSWGTGNPDAARMVELRMALYQISTVNFKKYLVLHIEYMNMYHELLNEKVTKDTGFVATNKDYLQFRDEVKKCLLAVKK